LEALDDRNWAVAGSALRLLRLHGHPEWRAAQIRVLRRAAEYTADRLRASRSLAVPPFRDWQDCVQLLCEALDYEVSMYTVGSGVRNDLTALLIPLVSNCQDAGVRARALTLLRRAPPHNWQPIVLAALDDSSERVQLAALEIVAANRWDIAATRVVPLASSPRPLLRQRAAAVLERLGYTAEPREYGDCIMAAASQLANQLAEAGVPVADALPTASQQHGDTLDLEHLNQCVEAYLDRPADDASDGDFRGVLLLAAAARSGQRKLTLRLWERESARVDSNAELLERGLETVARDRLLDGLMALRSSDQPAGLEALDSIARLAQAAAPHARLQAYWKHAGQLSAAARQSAATNSHVLSADDLRNAPDSVAQVADRLFDNLDLSRTPDREEAQRRLDDWCGIRPSSHNTRFDRRYQRLAN
jgi:hypothetical protein